MANTIRLTDREKKGPSILRRFFIGVVIGLGAGLIVTELILSGVVNPLGRRFADLFYRSHAPSGKVVIIAADDKTVNQYGWPIEEITHGGLLLALFQAQPKVIALDFLIADLAETEEDVSLAAILRRADKIVEPVLGIEATRFPSVPGGFPAFDSLSGPASALRTPNVTLGHTMIYPDSDGVVRHLPLAIDLPVQRYPAFGLAALEIYEGQKAIFDAQNRQVLLGDRHIPMDENGQMLIQYVGHDELKFISYADVVQGKVDLGIFRDKIVLVGPTTRALYENYNVPSTVSSASLYNVELQADMIETILSGNFLQEQDPSSRVATAMIAALVTGVTLIHFRRRYAAALTIIYLAGYLVYGFWQFDRGLVLAPLDVILALFLILVLTIVYRYFAEERIRASIARLFLGTVAPESVDQVLALYDRGGLALSGGRREASVLCAVLRGLTPLSETGAPEMVIQVMNRYAARIFEIVFQHGGSVHSQVGNTIIAMWNLPLLQADHSQRAVRAAFEIQQQIIKLNEETPGLPMVESGLGIATGPVVAGHLSSSPRAEYSVIGDVVNLAERLGILASENQVYVDPETRAQIREEFESHVVHTLRLRGKKDPVQVWELSPIPTLNRIPLP